MSKAANKRDKIIAGILSNFPNVNNIRTTSEFCRWDIECDECVFEVKTRYGRKYENTLIEKDKYNAVKADSRRSMFIVHSKADDLIYVFNLDKLEEPEWVSQMCKKTTEFANNNYVEKIVGYLEWDDASFVIDYKTQKIVKVNTGNLNGK